MRLTELAHALLGEYLRPGDTALDATAGNGHDTAYLARHVGASGHVYAMDVQETAVASARARLAAENSGARVTWITGDHARLAERLPKDLSGRLRAAVFNLGYLPGGNHALTTRPDATRTALESALPFLAAGGVLCVTCYRGHPGGEEEYRAVRDWFRHQRHAFAQARAFTGKNRRFPPVLLFAEKAAGQWQAH